MADLTKDANAHFDTSTALHAPQIAGKIVAGEAIDAVSPCYIKGSDGKVYMSNGAAANEAAKVDGWAGKAYKIGQPVTLLGLGTRFRYSAGTLTPGQNLFLGGAKGVLADAPSTGGTAVIARAIDATDIRAVLNSDGASGNAATIRPFVSAEQTGTGAPQNVAHGLGVVPARVLIVPTDTSPATTGAYTAAEGAHDATNVIVTVTLGKKFKAAAWA